MYTWEEIETMIQQCRRCPLGQSRKMAVMGRGSRQAKIMFVAEAPGAQEDLQGIPLSDLPVKCWMCCWPLPD